MKQPMKTQSVNAIWKLKTQKQTASTKYVNETYETRSENRIWK